jgi:hypothetical protein
LTVKEPLLGFLSMVSTSNLKRKRRKKKSKWIVKEPLLGRRKKFKEPFAGLCEHGFNLELEKKKEKRKIKSNGLSRSRLLGFVSLRARFANGCKLQQLVAIPNTERPRILAP